MTYTILAFVCASLACSLNNELPQTYVLDSGVSREDCALAIAAGTGELAELPEEYTSIECRAETARQEPKPWPRPRSVPVTNYDAVARWNGQGSYSRDAKTYAAQIQTEQRERDSVRRSNDAARRTKAIEDAARR